MVLVLGFLLGCNVVTEQCGNGQDDDGDGLIDCEQSICLGTLDCPLVEDCGFNEQDDDNDGLIDCNDPDCAGVADCASVERCDGAGGDEDGDGYADCDDTDCLDDALCADTCTVTLTSPVGGETFSTAATYTATWSAADVCTPSVDLELRKDGILAVTLLTGTTDDGSEDFVIPLETKAGTDYTICAVMSDRSAESCSDHVTVVEGQDPNDIDDDGLADDSVDKLLVLDGDTVCWHEDLNPTPGEDPSVQGTTSGEDWLDQSHTPTYETPWYCYDFPEGTYAVNLYQLGDGAPDGFLLEDYCALHADPLCLDAGTMYLACFTVDADGVSRPDDPTCFSLVD